MTQHHRSIVFLVAALGVIAFATPAAASDWFSFHVGTRGFGLSFGSGDWWVYGDAWYQPHSWSSYDAALSGYGQWIRVDGLGGVWRPYVAVDWHPYTYGRWVRTGLGWTWVSYEPWGYFPHHYGSWAFTHHGWVWLPGYTYHAANVSWVRWGGYVGWYPCPPRGWSHAARAYHHAYRDGYHDGYQRGWHDAEYATYVHWGHLGAHDVSRHAVTPASLHRSIGRTSRAAVGAAPTRSELRLHGAAGIAEASLERRQLRIGERTVTVQRPAGMGSSVERHARRTVERALVPADRLATGNRHVTPERSATRDRPEAGVNGRDDGRRSRPGSDSARSSVDRSHQTGSETRSTATNRQSTARQVTSPSRTRSLVGQHTAGQAPERSRSEDRQTLTRQRPRIGVGASSPSTRTRSKTSEPRTIISTGRQRSTNTATAPRVRPTTSTRAKPATARVRTQKPADADQRARARRSGRDRVSTDSSSGTRKTQRR
jgi:hypothetical protein